ncbi:MAG: fibronectin type III domain-containing protein [Desulfuromonadales bacterium]
MSRKLSLRSLAPRALRPALILTTGVLLIAMITACGKKGPVRPKLATLPAAPQEVTLQQQGNLFVLAWSIPSTNQDGSNADDLTGFRIKRLDYDVTDGCPTCREPRDEVAELDLQFPEPGQRIGNRIYWRDLDIRIGSGYSYAIAPLTVGGVEGPAASVHRAAQPPPPSPTALQVEAGDAQVAVQWLAPALSGGMELVGYNLYRRQAKRPFPIVPVNAKPLQATHLLDRGLDNGRTYEYRVSALVRVGDQLLESMASPGAQITPQ